MENLKRAKVIMLPTENKSDIWSHKGRNLYYKQANFNDIDDEIRYYLYIISNDEIKEGDWIYCKKTNKVFQIKSFYEIDEDTMGYVFVNGGVTNSSNAKKIIETTDTTLIEESRLMKECYPSTMGQPSQQFIEKYIESYNKGEVITDVLVEYENISGNCKRDYCQHWGIISCSGLNGQDLKSDILNPKKLSLNEISGTCGKEKINQIVKINPKDNTITIRKLKNNWNREEVVDILHKYGLNLIEQIETKSLEDQVDINQWIKENL